MRLLLPTFLLAPLFAIAQDHSTSKVHWVSIEEAQAAAAKDGKPLLIDMWTPWCGWCRKMDAATFNDERTAAFINANFHAVSFNAEGGDTITFNGTVLTNPDYRPENARGRNGTHQFAQGTAVVNGGIGYPTIVYITAKGELIGPDQGYKSPEDIEVVLNYVSSGSYTTVPLADYKATFQSARK